MSAPAPPPVPAANDPVFEHIIAEVLGQGTDPETPMRKAFTQAGIVELPDFLSLSEEAIEELSYPDTANAKRGTKPDNIELNLGTQRRIILFLEFLQWRRIEGDPVVDLSTLTRQEYNDFRIRTDLTAIRARIEQEAKGYARSANPPTTTTTAPAPAPAPRAMTAVDFKKYIKRDQALFPTLKDEKYQDGWHRSFVNQCRAQDLEEITDPNWTPSTPEEQAIFEYKQKFVYAILESKVLTSKGKEIVRKHDATANAQLAYKELLAHHTNSTSAQIAARDIQSYFTTAKFGDGVFRGGATDFIGHLQQQFALYEKLTQTTLPDEQKLLQMSRAVATIPELRQVKNTADILATASGNAVQYSGYLALLQSSAAQYDDGLKRKPKRMIYAHETDPYQQYYDAYAHEAVYFDGEPYDIDTPVSVIEANAHERARFSANMPKERWHALDPQAKQIWDQLSDKQKAIILGYTDEQPRPGRPPPRGSRPPRSSTRQVHYHDVEDAPNDDEHEDFVDAPQEPDDPGPETRHVNQAASQHGRHLPPHDIRRVLSQPRKHPPNGQLQTKMAHFTYRVTNHSLKTKTPLVDRGANGGIAGDDVRILDTHLPHREVDIEGIDNHRLNSVKIGTVAGVVQSHKGPVVAVLQTDGPRQPWPFYPLLWTNGVVWTRRQ